MKGNKLIKNIVDILLEQRKLTSSFTINKNYKLFLMIN